MVPFSHTCYILKLPSEILGDIIHLASIIEKENEYQYIHGWSYPEHSYVDLKSIALCCRRLYILVAPFLWKDKEFILPRKDDEKSKNDIVQMATDILSKKALFQQDHYLGEYVRSLNRDLTHGPHYNLVNSKYMAQLVMNLKALRIDFHPLERREEYGLCYFAEYCPHLTEIYLTHCRDTFNDFLSLYTFNPPLKSITLTNCTIKESTLIKLSKSLKLSNLLLQQVLIEPAATNSNSSLMDYTNNDLHPFHYQNTKSTLIPSTLYTSIFTHQHLTQLALDDAISCVVLKQIVVGSPKLEKLAIVLNELRPFQVYHCIQYICKLSHLSILSLAFRKMDPITKEFENLPCHLPSACWNNLLQLPLLKSLYISTTRILLSQDIVTQLSNHKQQLSNIIIHNIALATESHDISTLDEQSILELYLQECQHLSYNIEDWNTSQNLYTFEQAKAKGFQCFDQQDQVIFIEGFSSGI